MPARDWVEWHRQYDQPDSPLGRRLAIVQQWIREALDRARDGPVSVVSVCAGQGTDLIGALEDHPRRHDVVARLVELDERNVEVARVAARAAGLGGVSVLRADAGVTDSYADAVPAALVLACGVFGNVSDHDIAATIQALPQLCDSDGVVIWTRHRRPPDLNPAIRGWFGAAGFEEVRFEAPADDHFGVGAHVFRGTPVPLETGVRLFTFVGDASLHS